MNLPENSLVVGRTIEFQNPQKMILGVGAIDRVGKEAKRLLGEKILVISDENIEKAGILSKILKKLEEKELDINLYKIPVSEPTLDSTRTISDTVRQEKYDVVIGVGGGSCLDSAKLAAMAATNMRDVWEYCAKVRGEIREVENKTLPKILVPTTAGTGSEASNTLVIIEQEYKTWITDNKLLAEVAIVDPALSLSLPPRMTAGSGMDALSHAVEALMSIQANPVSDGISMEAVRLVFSSLRSAYHHGEDLEARRNMSLAATLGGWVIGFPWVGGPATIGHCVSEAVGPKYKIPHGVACAIALPYAIEYNLPLLIEKLARAASVVIEDANSLTMREAAFKFVEATLDLMEDVDIPTSLKEEGVPKADLKPLAENIVKERQYLYNLQAYNPRRLTLKNVTQLLEKMWEGRTT
jgi:alcohol dehydrogenase class IV